MNAIISPEEVRKLISVGGSLIRPEDADVNKFGVPIGNNPRKQDRIWDGICYDSAQEARHAALLDVLQRHGEIIRIERQVAFNLCGRSGVVITRIIIDFRVYYRDGRVRLEETKGKLKPEDKFKLKWLRADYPELWREPNGFTLILADYGASAQKWAAKFAA